VLLRDDEPAPFQAENVEGDSPFVIICDHAGRLLPRVLGTLGLSEEALGSHIAWDLGALGVARRLSGSLGACLVWQRYSRLVIDCNRPLTSPDSIVRFSERTSIPGNQAVSVVAAASRAREVFHPYHEEIRRILDERGRRGRPTVLVSLHSFTPVFLGEARPWHVGVLHDRDRRVAEALLHALRAEGDLMVGDNEPYAAGDATDYSIVQHGERRGLPHVELELRQDLITDETGQDHWGRRLARLLPSSLQAIE
jgi:predicted N-formylglutamate amidohydrolase